MLKSILPSRVLILLVLGASLVLAALTFTGLSNGGIRRIAIGIALCLAFAASLDAWLSISGWRRSPLSLQRQLPQAFAVGVSNRIRIYIDNGGDLPWRGYLFEMADGSFEMPGMPLEFHVEPRRRTVLDFDLIPTARGLKHFSPAQIMLRSTLGLLDWNLRLGTAESRRVFPNFARVSAYAWLATERRLADIGIKAIRKRGSATDFDQLVDYQAGDAIRHIDWKATMKHGRPIVRRFEDDRDQTVMFLLDCGRRMRADDVVHQATGSQSSGAQASLSGSHFDQALDAVMLLAYVALSKGDAVGALTFGTPQEMQKRFAPRKGKLTLNSLMAELADVQPTPTFSDYAAAATDTLRRHRKRSLLIVITNCRDEDAGDLGEALRLLKTRHVVILANLREKVVDEIAEQDIGTEQRALEVAAALQYEQQRIDTLRHITVGGVLMIDCEPRRLGIELVNRYTALKRAGSI